VENRGNSTATQVYVSASVPGGQITRYQVFADHPYTVHPNTDTSRGYLILALDSLAPGAKIVVYLWGSQVTYSSGGEISIAAVHDKGSAPISTELSSEQQIEDIVDKVLISFKESFTFVASSKKIQDLASALQIQGFNVSLMQIPPSLAFSLTIATITLAFLAWLFLDSVKAALIHGGLAAGICWLLAQDFVVPSTLVILSTIPFFILLVLRVGLIDSLITLFLSLLKVAKHEPVYVDIESGWMLSLSLLFLFFAFVICRIRPEVNQATGYITVGYIAAMASLAFNAPW